MESKINENNRQDSEIMEYDRIKRREIRKKECRKDRGRRLQ